MEAAKYVAQARKLITDLTELTQLLDYSEAEKAMIASIAELLDKSLEVLTK